MFFPARSCLKKTPSQRAGFALLMTIVPMSMMVLLMVSMTTMTRVETQIAANYQKADQARENALFAPKLALGQLLQLVGPDQRTTARADILGAATRSTTDTWNGSAITPLNSTVDHNNPLLTGVWGNRADSTAAAANSAYVNAPKLLTWLGSGNEAARYDTKTTGVDFGRVNTAVTVTPGTLLANGTAVTAQATPEGLVVNLPAYATDAEISVVRLRFPAAVSLSESVANAPDGRIELTAFDADPTGGRGGNFELLGRGTDTYLAHWKDAVLTLDYTIKVPTAGTWQVSAEFASAAPVKLVLRSTKTIAKIMVPAGADAMSWHTEALYTIKLPAGEHKLQLQGKKDGWKGGPNIRRVWLTPVSGAVVAVDKTAKPASP